VTVFIVLLGSVDLHGSWKWAALPVGAQVPPEGAPPSRLSWIEADQLEATGTRPALSLADLRGPDGARWWGVGWRLLRNPTPEALQAHYRARRGEPAADVEAIDFFRVSTPLRDAGVLTPVRTPLWRWKLRD